MKECYFKIINNVHIAVLDLIPALGIEDIKPDAWVISRVNTPRAHRGEGHARSLLKACLKDADTQGATLCLWINAYGDMSEAQLSAWYTRNGFIKRPDGFFIRIPQS